MNIDLVRMLGNLSQSLYPVQHMITGGAYVLGAAFLIIAISKLKKVAGAGHSSHEKTYGPLIYFLIGCALIFLPGVLKSLANTTFGAENVLTYGEVNKYDIYNAINLLIRTTGIIWFIRGCVLLTHASQPGSKVGSKGLGFLVAGILAMNIKNTIAMINSAILFLVKITGGKT
jgi:hypothetical protein